MKQYELIDPILLAWGFSNGIHWYSEYQDSEVKTFYLNANQRDRVQVAVDFPKDEWTTIRIGQNERGLSRLHRTEKIACPISQLSISLDRALKIANEWASH